MRRRLLTPAMLPPLLAQPPLCAAGHLSIHAVSFSSITEQALAVRPGFTRPPRALSLLLVTTLIAFAPGCMTEQVKTVPPAASTHILATDAIKKVFGTSTLDEYRRKIPRWAPTEDALSLLGAKNQEDFRKLAHTLTLPQILKIAKDYQGAPISRTAWMVFMLANHENPKNQDYKFSEELAPGAIPIDRDTARSLVLMLLDESFLAAL
jgi:hypothetical protein